MTDITDQEKRVLREWANENQLRDEKTHLAARYILATVDAPAPTLAKAIEAWAEKRYSGVVGTGKHELLALAARAEQMEHERDEARAEVERLTAERDRLEAAQRISDGSAWGGPVREPCAERLDRNPETKNRVEAALNNLDKVETVTVQKGAESNAESPNPADVKPGEAWQVLIDGIEPAVGFSANGTGWCCYRSTHGTAMPIGDDRITLLHRLVPAPRVITDPDELEDLRDRSIVLDGAGRVCTKNSPGLFSRSDLGLTIITTEQCFGHGPVTVLWEP